MPLVFSHVEYCDMHFVCGFCGRNARAAVEEYQRRFPDRRIPSRSVFTRIHQTLRDTGSLASVSVHSERQDVRMIDTREHILDIVQYHDQMVQHLEPGDHAQRMDLCHWITKRYSFKHANRIDKQAHIRHTSLRIALWNANGLSQHRDEIILFLKINFIDILLISESHFTAESYIKIPQYNTYSTNHPDGTAHGVTAIIVSHSIDHYQLPKFEENFLQATSIKVRTLPYDITISAAYCPPRHNNKKEDYQSFFSTLGNKCIAGGDYNSKHVLWGSRLTTTKGRELAKLMQEENYYYMSTGTPTYWPTDPQKTPDLLDFFVTKGLSSTYADVTPSFELSSDHTPVIATINSSVIHKQRTPKLHNNKTNWDTYREIIDNNINLSIKIKIPEDLNTTLQTLIDTLQKAVRRRRSKLSNENKILIYKTVIISIWTYGIELWGCASKSNTNIIQRSQSKILRMLVDAPWYVSNETLHQDLNLKFMKEIILDRSRQHMSKIETHEKELLQPLREPINNRRLKRKWPNDLI
ncbi:hypothetical protein B7P43_G16736 [Cryptotermes secundus]|uniref:DUF4817 domain-containing protein n=1 Tax=Cryptotermes secundus TaxID=105785 RepID=A0A2J7PV20_9NEOP|nr:hypothetical protein B7P43_G16736 [Cryptotermes secundus]